MSLPVIDDIFRVVLRWGLGGPRDPINVIHVAGVTSTSSDVFDSLAASVTNGMWYWVQSGVIINNVDITPLDGSTATSTFTTGGGSDWQGEATGNIIPQVAAVIKMQTAKRGRSYRGRIFLPAIGEDRQDNGALTVASSITTEWENFRIAMATETNPLVVASYKLSTAELVTKCTAESRTATQRRRNHR